MSSFFNGETGASTGILTEKGWSRFYSAECVSDAAGDPETVEKARIHVANIKAPILLVSGTDDQTWPAGEFCADIVARLKKAGFSYEVKHIFNEGGGHQSFLPYFITAGRGGGDERRRAEGGCPRRRF